MRREDYDLGREISTRQARSGPFGIPFELPTPPHLILSLSTIPLSFRGLARSLLSFAELDDSDRHRQFYPPFGTFANESGDARVVSQEDARESGKDAVLSTATRHRYFCCVASRESESHLLFFAILEHQFVAVIVFNRDGGVEMLGALGE